MISDERLNAMQEVCDAATWDGGWYTDKFPYRETNDLIGTEHDVICEFNTNHPRIKDKDINNNAKFMVLARTQMPELIAEIRELKKQLLENSPK